eukprot:8108461-Pyramimonas_sp.AAC.1
MFRDPVGALPKAPLAAFARAHRTYFGTPLTRFVAPYGKDTGSPGGCVRMRPPHPYRHTPHTC